MEISMIKTESIYVGIEKGVETRFGASNYELERPLHSKRCKKISD